MTGRRRIWILAGMLAALLPAAVMASAGGASAGAEAGGLPVTVTLDRDAVDAGPGEKVSFESTIENTGSEPLADLVAHMNILTTDPSVYVDPEDWSAERTQYLDELGPGESATLSWSVQAVTSGPLLLFVSVTSPTSDAVSSGGPIKFTVGGQRVVNAGGVLPLVVWMPAGVLALFGATLVRRRRHR
jgi:uncharacterized membrane protein